MRWSWGALVVVAGMGCDPPSGEIPAVDAGPSPNVSFQPSPIATVSPGGRDAGRTKTSGGLALDSAGRPIVPDAGPPPPTPIEPGRALKAEALGRGPLGGVTLKASWSWGDVPAPPQADEVFPEGIAEAVAKTRHAWTIDLSDHGRMRAVFGSDAMPLVRGSEIRKRRDRYGSVILWPNASSYRVLAPGSSRSVMGEGRADVIPLDPGKEQTLPAQKLLDLDVRVASLASSFGSVKLSLAEVAEAGEGGPLLCRLLLELAGIDPASRACRPGEVALRAEYVWQGGGGITFEVTDLARRVDLAARDMLVPPPGSRFETTGLPKSPAGIFLSREELKSFRKRAIASDAPAPPDAPAEGVTAQNGTDMPLYFLVDGIPIAVVPPVAERNVVGLQAGTYVTQWRSFLGDRVEAPEPVVMPAHVSVGVPETDKPDAG